MAPASVPESWTALATIVDSTVWRSSVEFTAWLTSPSACNSLTDCVSSRVRAWTSSNSRTFSDAGVDVRYAPDSSAKADLAGGPSCAMCGYPSGCERPNRPRRLLAAMPDRVNLPRTANVGSRIALKDHQVRKLACGQHSAIIQFEQRCGVRGGVVDRLHGREASFDHE